MQYSAAVALAGFLCVLSLDRAIGGSDLPPTTTRGRCVNATYIVRQMYQACPPQGRVVRDNNEGEQATASSRLVALEAKYRALEARMTALTAPSGVQQEITDAVHNVTKVDGSHPADCTEIFHLGYRCTGVYWIQPRNASQPFKALCELSYDGWTVLMRRYDGSVDFFRNWADYKRGFGSPASEHWLGNDNIHVLTSQKNYQLRVETTYWSDGNTYYTDYHLFKVDSEAAKYKLHVTGYSGISGYDGLSPHNGKVFSTKDRDNDSWPNHCAQTFKGGWWHYSCHTSQLTGIYSSPCYKNTCMEWKRLPLKRAVMKVKPLGR